MLNGRSSRPGGNAGREQNRANLVRVWSGCPQPLCLLPASLLADFHVSRDAHTAADAEGCDRMT